MTISSNIHIGLAAWVATTPYLTLGTRVSNVGNAYQLIGTGLSGATGPTGTGGSISDGTCTWKYLSSIDYTSIPLWIASIPSTLTQIVQGLIWNDGQINVAGANTTSAPYFIGGHTTTASNYIWLSVAAGEALCDQPASSTPLFSNASLGVLFHNTNTGSYNQLFYITDDYIVFDRMQFTGGDLHASTFGTFIWWQAIGSSPTFTLNNVLMNGYPSSNYGMFWNDGGGQFFSNNCVILDNQASSGTGSAINPTDSGTQAVISNMTVVGINSPSAGFGIRSIYWQMLITNCIVIGYNTPIHTSGGGKYTTSHNLVSSSAYDSGLNTDTGTIFNATASSTFVNTANDFRTKTGSQSINAGATGGPSTDFFGTSEGVTPDIGAFKFIATATKLFVKSLFLRQALKRSKFY